MIKLVILKKALNAIDFLANAGIQLIINSSERSFIEMFKRLYHQLDPRIREGSAVVEHLS